MYKEPDQTTNKLIPIALVLVAIGAAFALTHKDLEKQQSEIDNIRAVQSKADAEVRSAQIQLERNERLNPLLEKLKSSEDQRAVNEEQTASARVKTNCLWVDAGKNKAQKVVAGASLVYPGTDTPIPPKAIVCDRSGNTGEVGEDGRVMESSIARTRAAVPWEYHRSKWFKKQNGN